MKFKNMHSFSLTIIIIINIKTYTIIIIIIVIVNVFDTEINTGKLKHNCMYLRLHHNIKISVQNLVLSRKNKLIIIMLISLYGIFGNRTVKTSKRARSAEYSIKTNCWNGLGLANPKIVVNYG